MKTVRVTIDEHYPSYCLGETSNEQPGRFIRDAGQGYMTEVFIALSEEEFETWEKVVTEMDRVEALIEQKLNELAAPVDQRVRNK